MIFDVYIGKVSGDFDLLDLPDFLEDIELDFLKDAEVDFLKDAEVDFLEDVDVDFLNELFVDEDLDLLGEPFDLSFEYSFLAYNL